MPTFEELELHAQLVANVAKLGFTTPTPIQEEAIPPLLAGRDVIGGARTGSGKTAAFGLPMLHHIADGTDRIAGLVLAPTRELALQVTHALRDFARKLPVRIVAIYGGTPYGPQLRALRQGAGVLVATPGRLLDHIDRGNIDLSDIRMLVLDEADEMLRMGFIDDVEKILGMTPEERQVALFSATMPDPIRRIAERHLPDPLVVQVEDQALSVDHIEQKAILVPHRDKLECLDRVLRAEPLGTHLIFARTRRRCAQFSDVLAHRGMPVDALHGDLNQGARERVLSRLRAGRLNMVIATDVAARGIDVDHITHVINMDLPDDPETYVHRIGRTGRAGAKGIAISFVTPSQRRKMRDLERLLKMRIPRVDVPTNAEIARGQRQALVDRVRTALDEEDLSEIRTWLDELLADSDRDHADVAAAAIHLLAERAAGGFTGEEGADDGLPRWARRHSKQRPGRREREQRRGDVRAHLDANEVELFLAAGRNKRMRPGDIVGALCNEIGVNSDHVGRITVGARTSFVAMPRKTAEAVLADWDHLPIRGMRVPMLMSRPPSERKRRD